MSLFVLCVYVCVYVDNHHAVEFHASRVSHSFFQSQSKRTNSLSHTLSLNLFNSYVALCKCLLLLLLFSKQCQRPICVNCVCECLCVSVTSLEWSLSVLDRQRRDNKKKEENKKNQTPENQTSNSSYTTNRIVIASDGSKWCDKCKYLNTGSC